MTVQEKVKTKNENILHEEHLHVVRRTSDAVLDEAWIKEHLHRAAFGVLATEHNGQPFLNTNLYVYDEAKGVIYIHRDKVGRTSANLQANPKVCYMVPQMGRMLAGKTVPEFDVEYRSVVIFGTAEVVEDKTEANRALEMIMEKYAPHLKSGQDYQPIDPSCARSAAVYKVIIDCWSGKHTEAAPDHPGAYKYPLSWVE